MPRTVLPSSCGETLCGVEPKGRGLGMYGGTTLPNTGVGVTAGTAAFAGYTTLALVLAVVWVLLIAATAAWMRAR